MVKFDPGKYFRSRGYSVEKQENFPSISRLQENGPLTDIGQIKMEENAV
jgi:hypothetical protein